MKDNAANHLHIEVAHSQRAAARFPDGSKGLGEEFIESGTGGQAPPEFLGLCSQLSVAERLVTLLERIDFHDDFAKALQLPIVASAK